MKYYNTENLLCFHLNLFNNIEQVEKMIENRNLVGLDPEVIWSCKLNGNLKVWLDKETYTIVFWTLTGDKKSTLCINSMYLSELKNMKSICYDKKVRTPVVEEQPKMQTKSTSNINSSDLNQSILNIILDKISNKGIDSLSDKERDFLSKYSD